MFHGRTPIHFPQYSASHCKVCDEAIPKGRFFIHQIHTLNIKHYTLLIIHHGKLDKPSFATMPCLFWDISSLGPSISFGFRFYGSTWSDLDLPSLSSMVFDREKVWIVQMASQKLGFQYSLGPLVVPVWDHTIWLSRLAFMKSNFWCTLTSF